MRFAALRPRALLQILKEAAVEWDRDNVSRLAAALAYYAIFSLAPLLVIVVAVTGVVFGEDAARGGIVRQIDGLIGAEGARLVENVIREAGRPGAGAIATAAGMLVLLVGATGAFAQLQGGLNTVWEVGPKSGRVIRGLVRTRALSFAMVLGVGFLLLISLVLSAAVEAFGGYVHARFPELPLQLSILNSLLSLIIVTLLFAMIYRVLPDAEIAWRDVWLGAIVTSFLFTLGKYLIGLYLGHSSVGSAFGAAGTLAILLIWIYYSAQIFYFGAEITQVYTRRYGRAIQPASYATRIVRVRVEAESATEARRLADADVKRAAAAPGAGAAARAEVERHGDPGQRRAGTTASPAGHMELVHATDAADPDRPAGAALARREGSSEAPGPVTDVSLETAGTELALIGPEPSRFERFTAVVAGLLVGITIGALSLKRRVDVSGKTREP
ncbi:MAG: YihY/virulence factor BrkB family protein [Gemmatimonadota bacterium]